MLGPLLFLVYINHSFEINETVSMVARVDDISLFFTELDVLNLELRANAGLPYIGTYTENNLLKINVIKVKAAIFRAGKAIELSDS